MRCLASVLLPLTLGCGARTDVLLERALGDDTGVAADAIDAVSPRAAAPRITRVAWVSPVGCSGGLGSDYHFDITVLDPDTPASRLRFAGTLGGEGEAGVPDCDGAFDSARPHFFCINSRAVPRGGYDAVLVVSDPEGNTDRAEFLVTVCRSGAVMR